MKTEDKMCLVLAMPWREFNKTLGSLSETELNELMDYEEHGNNRVSWRRRIYTRMASKRKEREIRELKL